MKGWAVNDLTPVASAGPVSPERSSDGFLGRQVGFRIPAISPRPYAFLAFLMISGGCLLQIYDLDLQSLRPKPKFGDHFRIQFSHTEILTANSAYTTADFQIN
jgi:hypothetical protein